MSRDARSYAWGAYLIGAGPAIRLFVFRGSLVGHGILCRKPPIAGLWLRFHWRRPIRLALVTHYSATSFAMGGQQCRRK